MSRIISKKVSLNTCPIRACDTLIFLFSNVDKGIRNYFEVYFLTRNILQIPLGPQDCHEFHGGGIGGQRNGNISSADDPDYHYGEFVNQPEAGGSSSPTPARRRQRPQVAHETL